MVDVDERDMTLEGDPDRVSVPVLLGEEEEPLELEDGQRSSRSRRASREKGRASTSMAIMAREIGLDDDGCLREAIGSRLSRSTGTAVDTPGGGGGGGKRAQ